jgi:hypothetical protein
VTLNPHTAERDKAVCEKSGLLATLLSGCRPEEWPSDPNLINVDPLPLIRYEITDEITLLEEQCPCGSRRLVDDIQGRLDDSFTYADVGVVHPHVFRSRLGRERHVVKYQVVQTPRGATIELCCNGRVDLESVREGLIGDLQRLARIFHR